MTLTEANTHLHWDLATEPRSRLSLSGIIASALYSLGEGATKVATSAGAAALWPEPLKQQKRKTTCSPRKKELQSTASFNSCPSQKPGGV